LWSNALVCVWIPVVVCIGTLLYLMSVELSERDPSGDATTAVGIRLGIGILTVAGT
jgi:hypothetical protein